MEEYYNRNPTGITIGYFGHLIDPHGATSRDAYTVPLGRRAFLEYLYCVAVRDEVAQSPGLVASYFRFFGDGHEQNILAAELFTENHVLDFSKQYTAPHLLMFAGQKLEARTMDGSTGGKATYNLIAHLTEFDA